MNTDYVDRLTSGLTFFGTISINQAGHQIIVSYAECMGLPLFRRRIRGSTRSLLFNFSVRKIQNRETFLSACALKILLATSVLTPFWMKISIFPQLSMRKKRKSEIVLVWA